MSDERDDELEARLTLLEVSLALRLGEEGLARLREVLRTTHESFFVGPPTSLDQLKARPAVMRRLQYMEDRLTILEGFLRVLPPSPPSSN